MLDADQITAYKLPNMPADFDAWAELGVMRGASTAEVDNKWSKLTPDERNVNKRLAWKVLRDPAYAQVLQSRGNIPAVYDAGFFVDRLKADQTDTLHGSPHNLTTPFQAIAENMKDFDYSKGRPVVLVTTGGFSPIHWGHISMMETAKHVLEERGLQVVGGYISPSHDDYVGQKYNGAAKMSARHRIHLAHLAVEQPEYRDWLMVDPWESQYVPTDVNFTDVIRHLKSYLEQFVDPRGFDVMYVSGADNAGFIDVLRYLDGGVIVSRGANYNELPEIFERPEIASDPRLIFVRSEDPASEFSSSSVRKWRPQQMPADASKEYTAWRVAMMREDIHVGHPQRSYMIRDDGAWAMHQYFPDGPSYEVMRHIERFKAGLSAAIHDAFDNVEEPDVPRQVNVHYLPLGEQQDFADMLAAERRVLNLDVCTNQSNGINFSRLFHVADSQRSPNDLVSRPGFDDVETQIAGIESGEYLLIDDDIASGATVNHLMGLLPERIQVTGIQTLFNHSCGLHRELINHELSDMVDLRDFIIGSFSAGLVVLGPDNTTHTRAPYMLPFVSTHSRATIPLSSMQRFSQECWRLNAELFEGLGDTLTLESASDEFQSLMTQLGFTADTKLSTIARHYENFFQRASVAVEPMTIG